MPNPNRTLTAIAGVKVGHAQDLKGRTGTTVVLLDPPAMAFADMRGGWPGSYDTAASGLGKTFLEYHALFLTGGDVYGYDAAIGIRRFLLEKRLARPRGGGVMPAVMGTNIYDVEFGPIERRNFVALGARACRQASSRPVAQGTVGAGTGATVGPFFDRRGLTGSKGGLGSSASTVGRWTVGAMVVTNSVGNIFDPFEGRTLAGTHRAGTSEFLEMDDLLEEYLAESSTRFGTAIGIVGTDAPLDHEQLARLVELAHDGLALAVRPAHMSTDGDTLLGFSTGSRPKRRLDYRAFDVIHSVAVREVARAAVNAVRTATSLGGYDGLAGPGETRARGPRATHSP
jgi:L-aminopeptidase/D-esterase-like protein